jgi:site-specific DNA-methyltransferase (adenine-specific)
MFPFSQENVARIRASIESAGFLPGQEIVLLGGSILDGVHRYTAARDLGIDPPTVDYDGDDPEGYVLARNADRRDLNETQRACVAAALVTTTRGDNQHKTEHTSIEVCSWTIDRAAKRMGVSRGSVERILELRRIAYGEPDKEGNPRHQTDPQAIADLVACKDGTVRGSAALNAAKKRKRDREAKTHLEAMDVVLPDSIQWLCGSYKDHASGIPDGGARLLLTDPPYGMAYQSGRRRVKHKKIEGDSADAGDVVTEMLHALGAKMAADAHALIFCQWKHMEKVRVSLAAGGWKVRSCVVWVKNNHGSGDLGTFAPRHEFCLHASMGQANLSSRIDDVIAADKVRPDRHPTEKPVDLLQRLIEVCTDPGDLVLDPFGGVGTTAEACAQSGRRVWSCEIDEGYWAAGKTGGLAMWGANTGGS